MEDCIFCKIVAGTIPATKVYEDEHVLAFLDISPVNEGHTLVIPKTHVSEFQDVEDTLYVEVMRVTQKIAKVLKVAVPAKRVGLAVVGFDVSHTHIHVIPLIGIHDITSEKVLLDTKLKPTPEEFTETAEKIRKAL